MTRGWAGDGGCEGRYKPPEPAGGEQRAEGSGQVAKHPPPCVALRLCTAPRWVRMVAPRRRWASLVSLTCCLALLGGQLASAAPMHPKYPGDDAPVEELAQFYSELQQYLNMVTRPRYGKRSSSRTLGGDPYDAPGC